MAYRVRSLRIDGSWRVEVTELDEETNRPTTEHLHEHPFPSREAARGLERLVRAHLAAGLHLRLAHWASAPLDLAA